MSVSLSDIKKRFIDERPMYDSFVHRLKEDITLVLRKDLGSLFLVEGRAKDPDSLIKKIVRKGGIEKCEYEKIRDKAGLRIVVNKRDEISTVVSILEKNFEIEGDIEWKEEGLKDNQFCYCAVHCHLSSRNFKELQSDNLECEVQIRTIFQDAWSRISHFLAYKKENSMPTVIRRRVNSLSALAEIADYTVLEIANLIKKQSTDWPITLFWDLHDLHFPYSGKDYDLELSLEVISLLKEVCSKQEIQEFKSIMENFVHNNDANLRSVFCNTLNEGGSFFLSQPEVLMIFYLLEKHKEKLIHKWQEKYSLDYLADLANLWGTSLE